MDILTSSRKNPHKYPRVRKFEQSIVTISSTSSEEESDYCAICLDIVNEKCKLIPCFHLFCQTCLYRWVTIKPFCPVCRQAVQILIFPIGGHEFEEVKFNGSLISSLFVNTSILNVGVKCLFQDIKFKKQSEPATSSTKISLEDIRKLVPECNDVYNTSLPMNILRCFVYKYNLTPIYEPAIKPLLRSRFEINAENNRIILFALNEIDILKVLYNFDVDEDNFSASIRHIVNFYNVKSCDFRYRLKSLIKKYCTFRSTPTIGIQTLTFKFYTELNHFTSSDAISFLDYIKNIPYRINEENQIITLSESDSSEVELIGN